MNLGQKRPYFKTFFFRQYRPGKCLYRYSRTRKRLSRLKKEKRQNVEKLTSFQTGYPMVLVQNWPFFQTFFFRQYRPGKCLSRYSRTKKAFLGYKNKKLKKSKNGHFSKGANPWFGKKMAVFRNFFFRQYKPGKCLLRYSRTKKALLGYKNKKFKMSKNLHFSKGVKPWFWSKNGHYCKFSL